MGLPIPDAFFEYQTERAEQFAKDYYQLVATDIPLWAIEDELLYLMQQNKKTSFKIPGSKTRDQKDHIFHFELRPTVQSKITTYHYLGCS